MDQPEVSAIPIGCISIIYLYRSTWKTLVNLNGEFKNHHQ